MVRNTSVFTHGAVLITDFVTPAEEARILMRIAEAPWLTELSRRVQHYGFRYSYTGRGAREPAPPFPPLGHSHGPTATAAFRRGHAGAMHRQRIPAGAGHRDARRPPGLRRRGGLPLSRSELADALPPTQRASLLRRGAAGR